MPEPEVQPVLPDSPFTRELKPPSLHSYLAETLQAPYTTPFLLTITFSTAVLDSMTYNRFETFASNQTGNTVFLALAALHAGQRKMTLTLTSFAGFVASGLLFGQLGAYFGESRFPRKSQSGMVSKQHSPRSAQRIAIAMPRAMAKPIQIGSHHNRVAQSNSNPTSAFS
jgi:hypothetical protein